MLPNNKLVAVWSICFVPILADNWPIIFQHKLEWASSSFSSDCQSLDVVIKYYCTQSESLPFDTDDEYRRVCNDLTTEAFERYYNGEVKVGSQSYNVSISSEMLEDPSHQHFIVSKSTREECKGLSVNNVIVPSEVYHCNDIQFKYTVAHELGHGILIAADGIINSATHKGTSTLDQIARPDGQIANCDGSTTFDLMHYFPEYLPNCYDNGIRGSAFYENAKASETEIQTLVFGSIEHDGSCGRFPGSDCSVESECLPGLICLDSKCQECDDNAMCLPNQFCEDGSFLDFGFNHCRDKKPSGSPCQNNDQCVDICLANNSTCATGPLSEYP
ncbi:hypothetical protein TCAL_12991 [Tigriopus californicus]|uniref:Peptidase M12B domain-containing protein n=1 Tax=Tigriopus californicus TaxID=6832 RepID=A0A553PSR0_TIGCA|nr:uncharacterized protein LOC131891556 [Tigriopus californicus]TRY80722.1 hypothetical protein TCAL_12991 [Tigriopus californicus]|eukprot:TCALIF_12991-PA protein Name:"Protein of unknown function" AED:0.00 eAED:0.00 QI:10/1/0.83/1/0.8/0.83/6/79/330